MLVGTRVVGNITNQEAGTLAFAGVVAGVSTHGEKMVRVACDDGVTRYAPMGKLSREGDTPPAPATPADNHPVFWGASYGLKEAGPGRAPSAPAGGEAREIGRAQITMETEKGEPTGTWKMFVAFPGRVSEWPLRSLGTSIPTVAERTEILRELGWAVEIGSMWSWSEAGADDTGTVVLTAEVRVHRVGNAS